MQDSRSDKRRNVVPRWRSILDVPVSELRSSLNDSSSKRPRISSLDQARQAWEYENSVEHAVDLLDAAIMSRDSAVAFEAAAFIVRQGEGISDRVLLAASHALADKQIQVFDHELNAATKQASNQIIKRLRERLRIHSRDPITAVELSRLHARQGQHDSALAAMNQALALAPNSRFVLRAATRLFTMNSVSERALEVLRKSDALAHDPWLQSAEMATSELADRPSRVAGAVLRRLRGSENVPNSYSELAMALATLDEKSGTKRRAIYKLIKSALTAPTENALTQAVWLVERTGTTIGDKFPNIKIPERAHEALALDRFEHGDLSTSEKECSLWVADQPFQSRGPSMQSGINLVHFGRYSLAAEISERAIPLHPLDWGLVNTAVIANALDGKIVDASKYLERLKGLCKDDVSRSFLLAANGMVAFQEGRLEDGRAYYSRSANLAKQIGRTDLVAHAYMYYIEMEAKSGQAEEGEIVDFVKKLDSLIIKKYSKTPSGVMRSWVSRREMVNDALIENYSNSAKRLTGVLQSIEGDLVSHL